MEKYFVVIYKTKTCFSAHSPDVMGCIATGTTVEETKLKIKAAIELHFDSMLEDGEDMSKPQPITNYLHEFGDADYFTYVDISTNAAATA